MLPAVLRFERGTAGVCFAHAFRSALRRWSQTQSAPPRTRRADRRNDRDPFHSADNAASPIRQAPRAVGPDAQNPSLGSRLPALRDRLNRTLRTHMPMTRPPIQKRIRILRNTRLLSGHWQRRARLPSVGPYVPQLDIYRQRPLNSPPHKLPPRLPVQSRVNPLEQLRRHHEMNPPTGHAATPKDSPAAPAHGPAASRSRPSARSVNCSGV